MCPVRQRGEHWNLEVTSGKGAKAPLEAKGQSEAGPFQPPRVYLGSALGARANISQGPQGECKTGSFTRERHFGPDKESTCTQIQGSLEERRDAEASWYVPKREKALKHLGL